MNNIEQKLSSLISSQTIPHAMIFSGPKGVGKQKTAYQFASSLLQSPKIESHPDVHLFFPEGKTDMHLIGSMRALLENVFLAPFRGKWKLFIFHEAEKMLPTSSHALLKILEEPPSYTLFLLITEHPERLLPTLRSRCQRIDFPHGKQKNINPKMVACLAEGIVLEKSSEFEGEDADALFETVLFWYRDRLLLEVGGDKKYLHFPEHIEQVKKTDYVPLEIIEKRVKQSYLAYERSTKLSLCIEMLFLYITRFKPPKSIAKSV